MDINSDLGGVQEIFLFIISFVFFIDMVFVILFQEKDLLFLFKKKGGIFIFFLMLIELFNNVGKIVIKIENSDDLDEFFIGSDVIFIFIENFWEVRFVVVLFLDEEGE